MMEITREHVISAAHRLYEYGGRCERLHGHNYRILVTLTADRMNELGMVVDFVEVKRVLFGALEEAWDHRTLLFRDDPLSGQLSALLTDGSVRVVPFNPTAENIARWVCDQIPTSFKVEVQESEGNMAVYEKD